MRNYIEEIDKCFVQNFAKYVLEDKGVYEFEVFKEKNKYEVHFLTPNDKKYLKIIVTNFDAYIPVNKNMSVSVYGIWRDMMQKKFGMEYLSDLNKERQRRIEEMKVAFSKKQDEKGD